jgi:hypothetical protein
MCIYRYIHTRVYACNTFMMQALAGIFLLINTYIHIQALMVSGAAGVMAAFIHKYMHIHTYTHTTHTHTYTGSDGVTGRAQKCTNFEHQHLSRYLCGVCMLVYMHVCMPYRRTEQIITLIHAYMHACIHMCMHICMRLCIPYNSTTCEHRIFQIYV